ncbi:MAG TPA: iron ABC transporter permease [Burkholderiaceae bacterium]|nr:iron ABC transporter permease [Burkholderiaceae bacterium]
MTVPAFAAGSGRGRRYVIPALAATGVASIVLALMVGSVAAPWSEVIGALRGQRDDSVAAIVLDLRLPRALSAFAVGGLLALSGALLQALLRNPLADPYVLGISGGAAVAALIALAAGAALWVMQLASAAGALITLMLLALLARRSLFSRDLVAGDDAASGVLLTGVMIAALTAATLSLLLALAPEGRLRSMVFWLLGDLAGATDKTTAAVALLLLAVLAAIALVLARPLNLILRGDVAAFTQGVDVERIRRVLVVVAALATGCAVTLAGAIGFVGFVAPHITRRIVGNDQRLLLPAAALFGGALLVVADTIARTVVAPLQLPVGVLTALLGVPVFLWLLQQR